MLQLDMTFLFVWVLNNNYVMELTLISTLSLSNHMHLHLWILCMLTKSTGFWTCLLVLAFFSKIVQQTHFLEWRLRSFLLSGHCPLTLPFPSSEMKVIRFNLSEYL